MRSPIRAAALVAALVLVVPIVGVRAEAAGPQDVAITIQTMLGSPSRGPFVATGPAVDAGIMCPGGRTVDVSLVIAPDPTTPGITTYDVLKLFACGIEGTADTGSFVLRLLVRAESSGSTTYSWSVAGASGRFSGMTGAGTGYATPAAYGVDDHLTGALLAGPAPTSGTSFRMAGTWITTDCAQFRRRVNGTHAYDCTRFGDKSPQSLVVGSGAVPNVRLVDAYASLCVRLGKPGRFTATGYGKYLASGRLHVTMTEMRCGTAQVSLLRPFDLVLTASTSGAAYDEIWWDTDPHPTATHDWGYVFYRAGA